MFECVDRTIHCNSIPSFLNNNVEIINEPVNGSRTVLGTSLKFTCTETNYFFNYPVSDDLEILNKFNETTIICNIDS